VDQFPQGPSHAKKDNLLQPQIPDNFKPNWILHWNDTARGEE
jgi:hypothetical protein